MMKFMIIREEGKPEFPFSERQTPLNSEDFLIILSALKLEGNKNNR